MKLVIIKPGNYEFNKSNINEYAEERQVAFEDMMELLVTEIGLTQDEVGESPVCYETATHVYQICYVGKDIKKEDVTQEVVNPNNKPKNNIASYLFGDDVYGPAVFLCSQIGQNNTCLPADATIQDLVNILRSKFIHVGLFISADNKLPVKEYEYQKHPLDYYTTDENQYFKYKLVETEFLGFSLALFKEVDHVNNIVNKIATRIMGKKIFGDVVMLTKTPHEFHDLTYDIYNKISKLAYGPLKKRELLPDEKVENQKSGELPKVITRYFVLEKRYNNLKKVCSNCNKDIPEKKLVCGGCYRTIYHDQKCQKEDWNNHKQECLYNK